MFARTISLATRVVVSYLAVFHSVAADDGGAAEAARKTVLIVVGPSNHPPGTHEVAASAKLLQYALGHAEPTLPIEVEISVGWPEDQRILDRTDTVVFTDDRFPLAVLENRDRNMAAMSQMIDRGCGIVCFHYATGLEAAHVTEEGDHPLLGWIGGYFATRCTHHQSVARIFQAATIEPSDSKHPVLHGVETFTIHDEPYIENYFGPQGIRDGVVPLATSMLPPEAPKKQIVAWATQRADGGRGVGVVMPHFFANWEVQPLRKLIVNSIVWTAGVEIPARGVHTEITALGNFQPAAVEP